jgi:5,10-methylenetetrahydromethanopterin reductase
MNELATSQRVSVSADGRDPPAAFDAKVTAGEAGGAVQIWLANHLFQRDPVALAARVLGATARMKVALMAMSPFTMHPVQAAMAAATLDEYYPGRVTLCYGVGAPADLDSVGIAPAKPLRPMREALEISRALLEGETVTREGQAFRVRSRSLVTGQRRVPIVLAASGPQMLELAGASADGVLISAASSVEFVRWCMDHVRRGAAGRTVRASGLVYASVGANRAEAGARVRRMLAITLRGEHHRLNLELGGTRLDQEALRVAAARNDWAAAEALITEAVIERHAASGDAAGVRERFAQYHAAGLDEVVISGAREGGQVAALLAAVQGVSSKGVP